MTTNFTDGVLSYGMPLFPPEGDIYTGNTYFVHSGTGSDTEFEGDAPDKPLATLDAALTKCTANNDDRIILMSNHAETITGAGGITLDKAGVSIIGLGRYDARPAFLMDGAATVTMLVTSANVSMKNCIFRAGHADIAKFCLITAKGFRLHSCLLEENVATENWVDCIHTGAADNDYDGLELINNEIIMDDAASVTAIDLLKNANDVKIIGNRIKGDFDATPYAPIYCASTEIQKNIVVAYNYIHNVHDANAVTGISIANTASTGWIVHNHVGHKDILGETPVLAGAAGLYCGENYASGVLGTASGYLYPAADS